MIISCIKLWYLYVNMLLQLPTSKIGVNMCNSAIQIFNLYCYIAGIVLLSNTL